MPAKEQGSVAVRPLRVLFLNPAFRREMGGGFERYLLGAGMRFPWSLLKRPDERPRYAMFPLFMAYAAAVLERDGFDVRAIDAVPLNLSEDVLLARTRECRPDVIVLEPNAANVDDTLRLLVPLRALVPARMVLVGSHATACVAQLMKHAAVDQVVLGEYELALLALLRSLRDGLPAQGLLGVVSRARDGTAILASRSAPIDPLDALPLPARHLFPAFFDADMSVYRDGFCQHSPAFHMHTSRGCPFRCDFCDRIQVLFGESRQRFFSPRRIVDEMESLARAGAREIYIDDDNFTSNRAHVRAVCGEITRRGLRLPWSAMCDAMGLTPELLGTMATAGCIGIKFGLDSADTRVLHAIRKPLRLGNVERIVAAAKRLHVKTHMSVVLGLTGETKQSLERTLTFARRTDVDSIQFSVATPLPGTAMHRSMLAQGRLLPHAPEDLDGANRSVVLYPGISREELEAFMAGAHTAWLRAKFRDPVWLLRQVRFLARTAASQGMPGIKQRMRRAQVLLQGDAHTLRAPGGVTTMRL